MTINQLFDKVWADHWNTPRFKRSGWAVVASNLYKRLIAPTFGTFDQEALTASQIRMWHNRMGDTPLQANRALGVLSKMLSFAEECELRPQGQNVCRLVKPFIEKKRKRFATEDELRKVLQILDRELVNRPLQVAFIYTLIFSGARPISLERAVWGEFSLLDGGYGLLTFDGKSTAATGEDELVIIPPEIVKLYGQRKGPNDLIIGIKKPKDFWYAVRKEAGCPDLQARDLRRTFATVGLSNGLSKGIIGELLNHHSPATTDIYAKLMNQKRLEATKTIYEQIDKIRKVSNG